MSSENVQSYETQKHQIISSEPSYQVSADQKQDTNTPSEQKPIFQRKQILFVEKCYYWEKKKSSMWTEPCAMCWVDICVCLQIFKKAKQMKKKKIEVCKVLDSKHEGHKKNPSLCKR